MMASQAKEKTPIPKSTEEIEEFMKKNVGLGKSFDLGVRKLKILHKNVQFYYVNGLCDTAFIIELAEELVRINDNEVDSDHLFDIVQNRLVHQSVTPIKSMDELVDEVLSGLMVVVIDGYDRALVVDVRSYPGICALADAVVSCRPGAERVPAIPAGCNGERMVRRD